MQISRRRILELTGLGLGQVVLSALLSDEAAAQPNVPV